MEESRWDRPFSYNSNEPSKYTRYYRFPQNAEGTRFDGTISVARDRKAIKRFAYKAGRRRSSQIMSFPACNNRETPRGFIAAAFLFFILENRRQQTINNMSSSCYNPNFLRWMPNNSQPELFFILQNNPPIAFDFFCNIHNPPVA